MEKVKDQIRKILNIIKKRVNKKMCIALVCIVVISIGAYMGYKYIYPQYCIDQINENYSEKKIEKVAEYDSKLDLLKSFLEKDFGEYREIQYKVKISKVEILYKNKEFDNALKTLQEILKPDDVVWKKMDDCRFELGKKYLKEKKYDKAIEELEKVSLNSNKEGIDALLDDAYYNVSLNYLENKNYESAAKEIQKVKNVKYNNLAETKKQIYYAYGVECFNNKKYDDALTQLKKVGNYKDAKKYIDNAGIVKGENLIAQDDLKGALKVYNQVSDKAQYNGIKAAVRKKQLKKAETMIKATGRKYASKIYYETRNVWNYDGSWEGWSVDDSHGEYIDLKLHLNKEGTFNLEGTVDFYVFDDYSSLREHCQVSPVTKTINMRGIKEIPSTYKIDEYTKLLYSKGKFTLKYKKRDDYSVNFHNIYSSTVTY